VTPGGPHPEGVGPDDAAQGGRESRRKDDAFEDASKDDSPEDAVLKGWIPPEDRLWRHPSELWRASADSSADAPDGRASASAVVSARRQHRLWQSALVGTAASAVVIGGVLLLMSADNGGSPAASPGTTAVTAVDSSSGGSALPVPSAAATVGRSMLPIQVVRANGTTEACAVAVTSGGLLATTAEAVAGATAVYAEAGDGRRTRATVVGVDRQSDVALLKVTVHVPAAPFTQAQVSTGGPVMVMGVRPSPSGQANLTEWSPGTIRSAASPVVNGGAEGLAAVAAVATYVPAWSGDALLAPDGSVLGIFEKHAASASGATAEVFLPSALVTGVSQDLATRGKVRHGWLDVTARDIAPGRAATPGAATTAAVPTGDGASTPSWGGGAMVEKVNPNGPAAQVLQPGDVIQGVDGQPVRSMAELRLRLYLLPPGTSVELSVDRGGTEHLLAVHLASRP